MVTLPHPISSSALLSIAIATAFLSLSPLHHPQCLLVQSAAVSMVFAAVDLCATLRQINAGYTYLPATFRRGRRCRPSGFGPILSVANHLYNRHHVDLAEPCQRRLRRGCDQRYRFSTTSAPRRRPSLSHLLATSIHGSTIYPLWRQRR